jgi:hypothetical protein
MPSGLFKGIHPIEMVQYTLVKDRFRIGQSRCAKSAIWF